MGRRRGVLGPAWLLAVVLLLAGCTSTGSSGSPSPTETRTSTTAPAYSSYVALGDSYTAGPFIASTDLAGGCFRSDHNYPSLLARRLAVPHFTDVSCSAATTTDLAHGQHTLDGARLPPQLAALHHDTALVTLGIGGNDFGLFSTLVQTCTGLRSSDPTGAPCTHELATARPHLFGDIRRIGTRVGRALTDIARRSPSAKVVLVGYLRLAPLHGTCPARLPLADGDYPEATRVSRALSHALAGAAAQHRATYVDMFAASRGHDVCAARPWVNGSQTIRDKAFAYHPLVAGMRAVAAHVAHAVR